MYAPPSSLRNFSQGFSLVEISIVLVIIGMLVGGILTGKSLIHAAELRSVMTELQNFKISIATFQDKYVELPGDMTNATSYWGDNNSKCPDAAVASGTPGTCNGNGDGTITQDALAPSQPSEGFMFWQHLANAGLVKGNFTGIAGTGVSPNGTSEDADIGVNVPGSILSNAAWGIEDFMDPAPGDTSVFSMDYGKNTLEYGSDINTGGDIDRPLLTPEDAYVIDIKIDDGKPGYGNIIGKYWNNQCSAATDGSSSANNLDAYYRVSDNSVKCALEFKNVF